MIDDTPTTFLALFSFLIGCLFGGVIVLGAVHDDVEAVRDDAIKAGVAHWSIDPTTGNKSFVFQSPTKAIHNE